MDSSRKQVVCKTVSFVVQILPSIGLRYNVHANSSLACLFIREIINVHAVHTLHLESICDPPPRLVTKNDFCCKRWLLLWSRCRRTSLSCILIWSIHKKERISHPFLITSHLWRALGYPCQVTGLKPEQKSHVPHVPFGTSIQKPLKQKLLSNIFPHSTFWKGTRTTILLPCTVHIWMFWRLSYYLVLQQWTACT